MTSKTSVPGTCVDGIEFFVHADEIESPSLNTEINWTEVPFAVIQRLNSEINANAVLKACLMNLHPSSVYDRLTEYVVSGNGFLDGRGPETEISTIKNVHTISA